MPKRLTFVVIFVYVVYEERSHGSGIPRLQMVLHYLNDNEHTI